MIRENNIVNDVEETAIKAYAATTKTPFRVAFMATLGIAAAHLVSLIAVLTVLATVGGTLLLVLSR